MYVCEEEEDDDEEAAEECVLDEIDDEAAMLPRAEARET